MPRQGRLICVDLADYLYTWRPGQIASLYMLPLGGDAAELGLTALRASVGRRSGVRALNLGFHLDPRGPDISLEQIDRYASRCRELLLPSSGDMVFTDVDRMDGAGSSVDLLVVHQAPA
jgi:hypothetical protein